KNRTDFVLEAARAAAEEALIEQRIIMADPEAYQEFLVRLDQTLRRPRGGITHSECQRTAWY
ncbi:DUF1778 domain-containing protein, partial [Salmonella enterica]|nr:DUF1778 domain-containing protein [Salmonella enterica]